MSLWQRGVAWVKANPDRVVPASLVALIIVLLGCIFLVNYLSSRSKVPTPFEIDDPEKPAIQVGDQVEISRRMVAGVEESLYRQAFSAKALSGALAALSPEDRRQFLASPGQFCKGQLKGVDLKVTASDPERPVFNACLSLAQSQFPLVRARMAADAVLLADQGYVSRSSPLYKTALDAAYRSVIALTGASSRRQALARSGLSAEDVQLTAQLSLARDRLNGKISPVTDRAVRREFEAHPSRYRNPARVKAAAYNFPSIGEAKRGYELLKTGKKNLSKSKIPFSYRSPRWLEEPVVPPAQRRALSSASSGVVLKPFQQQGVATVLVIEAYQPATPATFAEAQKRVRQFLENRSQREFDKQLKMAFDRWSASTYCEEVMAAAEPRFDCGRSEPR